MRFEWAVGLAASALMVTSAGDTAPALGEPVPVWVWNDYENNQDYKTGMPGYMQLCMQALRHNAPAPHFEIHMVDKHSIRKFVPDMPPEFDRLPYPAATSDLVRTALLAHHGGAYLDTDFLLAGPMAEYTGHLSKADFVGYESFGQDCKEGSFSSNFIAGRKGNLLSVHAWDFIKLQLKQKCMHKDGDDKQGVCCYTPTGTARQCHIPWAALGEGTSHPIAKRLVKSGLLDLHCLDVHQGFVPNVDNSENMIDAHRLGNNNAQWMKIDGCEHGVCACVRQQDDLRCTWPLSDGSLATANITGYFSRLAYHLFASTLTAAEKGLSQEELLQGTWTVSELYRRALRQGADSPSPDDAPAKPGKPRKVGVKDPFRRSHRAQELKSAEILEFQPRGTKKGIKRPPDFGYLHHVSWGSAAGGGFGMVLLWVGRRYARRWRWL